MSGTDTPDPDRVIALGRVVGPWGVRGWIKVEPFAGAQHTTLARAPRWRLDRAEGPAQPGLHRWIDLERARRHSGTVVAKPVGCEDRDGALALKGAEVGVRRRDFPPLGEDEVYWADLVGCALSNPAGEALGTVSAVDDHGAHPILVTDAGVMVPFVEAYLVEVDPERRRIVVDWRADWSR